MKERRPEFQFAALVATAIGLVVGAGCSARPSKPSPPATPAQVDLSTDTFQATDACEILMHRIRRVIAEAPLHCTLDDECAIYSGGAIDCGEALDKPSAGEVDRLTVELRQSDCRLPFACAPRSAKAVCADYRCIEVSGSVYREIRSTP